MNDRPIRILYRGSLSSCNYDCDYCPFAKTSNTREELEVDARQLERFVEWVARRGTGEVGASLNGQTDENDGIESSTQTAVAGRLRFGILFTPWGEALVRSHYRRALVDLSNMPHVDRVAIQTNLSCQLAEFAEADRSTLAFWATYHPSQISIERFLDRCGQLDRLGLRYSVGVVGLKEHFEKIEDLRSRLAGDVYMWVNAFKRRQDYYTAEDVVFLKSLDPHFELNRHYYPSLNEPCHAGETSFTVDGDGDVRRCHFIKQVIGNIYRDDIFSKLRPRTCTNQTCGCHIGYVHLKKLQLENVFGENLLERIPKGGATG